MAVLKCSKQRIPQLLSKQVPLHSVIETLFIPVGFSLREPLGPFTQNSLSSLDINPNRRRPEPCRLERRRPTLAG